MSETSLQPPKLPYGYEFEPHELADIKDFHDAHGFVVVKCMLSPEHVEELKDSVRTVLDPNDDLQPGETRARHGFIECSRPLWKLLEDEPFLSIYHCLLGTTEMTVHRSAALLKNVGAGVGYWHTDWCGFMTGPPRGDGQVLNFGEFPSGAWFYLNGTHPSRAGLAVIAGSHTIDWPGPEGFEFTEARVSFYRRGEEPQPYDRMDVPGMVPLFTDPGDLIIFAARTYHGVFPHHGDEPRLSCTVTFRPGQTPLPTPWMLPESTRRFIEAVPSHLRAMVEHYPGLDPNWRG
jgi:hypothetical protein